MWRFLQKHNPSTHPIVNGIICWKNRDYLTVSNSESWQNGKISLWLSHDKIKHSVDSTWSYCAAKHEQDFRLQLFFLFFIWLSGSIIRCSLVPFFPFVWQEIIALNINGRWSKPEPRHNCYWRKSFHVLPSASVFFVLSFYRLEN